MLLVSSHHFDSLLLFYYSIQKFITKSTIAWMVDSALPIAEKNDPPVLNAVSHRITTECRGNYSFPSWDWSIISENAKSLIRSLLKMKVKERD